MKIRIFPHGITLGPARFRPAMIFRDKSEQTTLPVWLDQVDAGILLASTQAQTRASGAHRASLKIFKSLGIELRSIYFDEVTGSTQYATVTVVQEQNIMPVKVRAAEVMSLAVNAQCVFYTNENIIEKSRQLNLEWLLQTDLVGGQSTRRLEGIH